MLISLLYPLPEDFGFPNGVSAARKRWAKKARADRNKARWGAVAAAVGLTFLFTFFGMLPWIIQRATSPGQLKAHLSSNMPMGNAHLGAEYYNIAAALNDGRGFSDPFVVESGPTAWMPPLLVWIQAGLIWLFNGDRYEVMVAVVMFKALLLAVCGAAVVREGWKTRNGWVAFPVFAAFIFAEFNACFSFTHDSWLILAGVTLTVFGLASVDRIVRQGKLSLGIAAAWGCIGGLVAFSSPVAGFAWAIGTTVCLVRRAPKHLATAAMVSILVVTPWAIRNHSVFGKFVPMKSNVYFEFDQSLTLDSDGLLDWQTMSSHPYHAGPEQDAYIAMGEIAYLETKKERFWNRVKSDPGEFYGKMKNRLVATTLWPAGFSGFHNPFRWMLYPWPAIAAIGLVLFCRPLNALQRYSIVIYAAYLFPYIVCSYYPRYGFPLFVIKILLCFWMIQWMIRRVRNAQLQSVTQTHPLLISPEAA